jgi:hypothetical protein
MPLATLSIADSPTADDVVWTDGWIVDPRNDTFYVLSLLGTTTAVRALQAAVTERATLRLTAQGATRDLVPVGGSRYHTRAGRLPSGAAHAVVSCTPVNDRLIVAESEAALPRACFEDLVLHRGLMALPEWAPRLFALLLDRNYARRLDGPLAAVLVGARDSTLDQLVRDALQTGAVAFPPEDSTDSTT